MFSVFDKTDSDLKQDVLNELMWDPSVTSTQVKVAAKNGVVTLTGTVPHYSEKLAAEHAAERVGGVRAVADELEVKGAFDKTDEEIARAAVDAIKWNYSVPNEVKVSVSKGWVTLVGEVNWDYQRNAAKNAVADLLGVRGVTNSIKIKSQVQPSDIKKRIQDALRRSAEAEGRNISVSVENETAKLSGKVHSLSDKIEAGHAAWMAPGIMTVVNNLEISK